MVEKIYLTPGSVRGLGNIVSPKSYTDFKGNYSEIYVNENGDFVLGYNGYIILFNTRVSDTIKDFLASLTVTVLTAEDLLPVTNHSVEVTIDESTLTEVTDSNGVAVFTWTPTELGETPITISCSKQGDYSQHSEDLTVTVGVLLSLNLIMTGMTCEDDEYYEGTSEQQVESRTQLGRFITGVKVASGGERVLDNEGYMRVATDGDLLVSYGSIDDNPDYWNVLFEDEVDRLVGAVTGVSITSDEDIVLTRLERSDIVDDVAPSYDDIVLSADDRILSYYDGDSTTLRAQLMDGSSTASVSGVTVEFFKGSASLGTAQTDSNGVATKTYTSTGEGDISLTASDGTLVSEICSIEDCFNAFLTEQSITNSSGTKISSVGLDTIYNIRNVNFSLEFTHTGNGVLNIGRKSSWSSTTANYRATIGYADGKHYYATRTTSSNESYGDTASTTTEYKYKITRNDSTISYYVDDALIGTKSFSTFDSYDDWSIYSIIWGSGTSTISNIKLKPL